ncbi:TPA: hypothetical protein ACSE38_003336 [Acinetobacter baumannii]|uniref:Uncharacterized protein n=13 Tax=Acinetobacter calcoaceticus/baumannii complex TaxID=909768 RepID=A0ABX6CDA4_ACIB2|nr:MULTISPECIES: hypothetical protein [Gammaproteobacteria]ADX91571.1 hypothetical protein ABTW07_1142 [Acinetobacter baumannii TCDC-AB0715]AHX29700.1 hypothetical protein A478_14185 [Acinetobacter baumannii AC12]AHX67150.1 hypothetical protein B856_18215 [Acinetobacter baumannii AC30]ALJ99108.1 hypothetical protein Ab1052phi_13 [Acinetobacter phage Ab105-2phi]EMT83605.1 hypothetical protein ABNIH5_18618 [Acinetobacter baumannii ABNIH5]ETY67181.1 hypothetical protein X964_16875 [Acinetobacter
MKTEIIEALALELTKATIADTDPSTINIKSADLWVKTYQESLKAVEEALKELKPKPKATSKPISGMS